MSGGQQDGAAEATLTAIRRRALTASTYAEWHQVAHDVETLAEQLAVMTARAEKAESRLAEIGETREEWATDGPGGWAQDPTGIAPERYARNIVEYAAKHGVAVKLMRRLAGEWREVPDA